LCWFKVLIYIDAFYYTVYWQICFYIVSCLLNKPIKLLNARAKRENPG
jgi:hypothetical protein